MAGFDANPEHACGHGLLAAPLSRVLHMAPFSSCYSMRSSRETNAACQIVRIHQVWRNNPGRFDTVEALEAESSSQIDLKEVDMLPDGDGGF